MPATRRRRNTGFCGEASRPWQREVRSWICRVVSQILSNLRSCTMGGIYPCFQRSPCGCYPQRVDCPAIPLKKFSFRVTKLPESRIHLCSSLHPSIPTPPDPDEINQLLIHSIGTSGRFSYRMGTRGGRGQSRHRTSQSLRAGGGHCPVKQFIHPRPPHVREDPKPPHSTSSHHHLLL